MSRRRVLQAAVAVPLVGVSGCGWLGRPMSLDQRVIGLTLASEMHLIALYTAALDQGLGPRGLLDEIRANHREHLQALLSPQAPPVDDSVVGDGISLTTASLAIAERVAANQRVAAALQMEDPAAIEVLARIGASEASHAQAWRSR